MRAIILLLIFAFNINLNCQNLIKYGMKAASSLNISATLLNEYKTGVIGDQQKSTTRQYYEIKGDSIILYTISTVHGVNYFEIYKEALAVKDIKVPIADIEKNKDSDIISFTLGSKIDDLVKGTNYYNDKVEVYSSTQMQFGFSSKDMALAEGMHAVLKEVLSTVPYNITGQVNNNEPSENSEILEKGITVVIEDNSIIVPGDLVGEIENINLKGKNMGWMRTYLSLENGRATFTYIITEENAPIRVTKQYITKEESKGLVPDISVLKGYKSTEQLTKPSIIHQVAVGFRLKNKDVAEIGNTIEIRDGLMSNYIGTQFLPAFESKIKADAFAKKLISYLTSK
jgi:hypothetical protein